MECGTGEGTINALHRARNILHLEITAGFESIEGFLEDWGGIAVDGNGHEAAVDVGEGAWVDPFVFYVIDFEC